MSYAVKEMFLTLQGEGVHAGRRAVFCRFAGCNLWSGREMDRATAACTFCDTDFVGLDGEGGGRFADAAALADAVTLRWGEGAERRFVVLTGGEPMLQVDAPLIDALHARGFEIAIESNGTLPVPRSIDWICISPKGANPVVQTSGDELKLVWPQAGVDPVAMEGWDFAHWLVQPRDDGVVGGGGSPDPLRNARECMALINQRPRWRLSLQTHKLLGIA